MTDNNTVTLPKADLDTMIAEAVAAALDKVQATTTAAPVVAPLDLTEFKYKTGKTWDPVAKEVFRFVKDKNPEAPHTYSQRTRLLALADRGGPSFDQVKSSGMNRITAAVASYHLERGRPVTFKGLTLVPRMA